MAGLPGFAAGPLATLDNLVLPHPRVPKARGRNGRLRQIEKRFGVKQRKKGSRRSMDQLMIDLTPKWQRPAMEDRKREKNMQTYSKDTHSKRGGSQRNPSSNRENTIMQSTKKTRPRENKRMHHARKASNEDKNKRHRSRGRPAQEDVETKFSNMKPAWREVAALEADDGSTRTAISSLLHSGIRLSMHSDGSEDGSDNFDEKENTPGMNQNNLQVSSLRKLSNRNGNAPSWEPRFTANPLKKSRSKKATSLLMELNCDHSKESKTADALCKNRRVRSSTRRELPGAYNISGSKVSHDRKKRGRGQSKLAKESNRKYGYAPRDSRTKTSSIEKMRGNGQKRNLDMHMRCRRTAKKTESMMRNIGKMDRLREHRLGRQRARKTKSGGMTFLTDMLANSSDFTEETQSQKIKKSQKFSASMSSGKGRRGRRRGRLMKNGLNGSARHKASRSKSHTPLRNRHRLPKKSHRRALSGSNSLTSLSRSSSSISKSSTFLTSIEESYSPTFKRRNPKVRKGIRRKNFNDENTNKPRIRQIKRSVKSAPVSTLESLRLSPDSRRLRMAWMQKPVLNSSLERNSNIDERLSIAGHKGGSSYTRHNQRRRYTRNALSARLRKSNQKLARLSSSVRRQRNARKSSLYQHVNRSPTLDTSDQSSHHMHSETNLQSPPSPTLEQMAFHGDTGGSAFLTSSELLEPKAILPTYGKQRDRRKRVKKPNFVRQLGPAF